VLWSLLAYSHVTGGAQPLEGVFGLTVHGPASPLWRPCLFQLDDDFLDSVGIAVDGEGDVLVAERAVALAILGEVELDDRNGLARDVARDVHLGPMQQRVDAQVRARR